ncbi:MULTISPECIES: hypothetical protein [Amycolatopsis]|uniref:hypothetical protein n=1 Tax=Amycolatopsis TaxID=1813 RepID=UPI000690BF87|nr:hypothetical protein [Amycolatopsis nivea]
MRTRLFGLAAVAAIASGSAFALTGTAHADDAPPPINEDYSYPGAAKIFQDRAIKLISGDGHILLAKCGSEANMVEVHAYNSADHDPDPGHYCFRVTGPAGRLRMEVPFAYQVWAGSHTAQATVAVSGKNSTVPLVKNGWTGIGEGAGTDPATLLELTTSP